MVSVFSLIGLIFLYRIYLSIFTVSIPVYFTNDLNGWIYPCQAENSKEMVGGLATLASFLEHRKKPYLLLDAGNFFSGTPEGDLTQGETVIGLMNRLNYDAVNVGESGYLSGEQNLRRLAGLIKSPVLAANVYRRGGMGRLLVSADISQDNLERSKLGIVRPYLIKEFKKLKIGIIGIAGSKLISGENSSLFIADEVEETAARVKELSTEKVDLVLVLSHAGFDIDRSIAAKVPGISLIIGGRSCSSLEQPYRDPRNGTLVVQTPGGGTTIGEIELKFNRKKKRLLKAQYRVFPLFVKKYEEDQPIKEVVDQYRAQIKTEMNTVIGEAANDFIRSRNSESVLGNWQTDLMRFNTGTDIAFQDYAGMTGDLRQGKITKGDVYNLTPFKHTLVTMRLKGAQIKEILEKGVPNTNRFLQVSGLAVTYDLAKPAGERVVKVVVGLRPLSLKRNYKVAVNSQLASGANGFKAFLEGDNINNTGIKLYNLEEEYIRKNYRIARDLEKRINFISGPD